MLALVAAAVLPWQDPEPASVERQPADAREASARTAPALEPWSDQTAKQRVAEFEKLLNAAPNLAARHHAVETLAGANRLVVKPLVRVIETDASVVVQKRAVQLLAGQPVAQANDALARLLQHSRVQKSPALLAEVVRGLSHAGYTSKQWELIDGLFERDYDPARVPIHDAILDLVTQHRERKALPLLLRNLDEPAPENVDAADNPPAEYWKARWQSWSAWRGKVKAALFAITGQNFSTSAEAKAWLRKNPLK